MWLMRQLQGCLPSFEGIFISVDGGIGRRTRFKPVRTVSFMRVQVPLCAYTLIEKEEVNA